MNIGGTATCPWVGFLKFLPVPVFSCFIPPQSAPCPTNHPEIVLTSCSATSSWILSHVATIRFVAEKPCRNVFLSQRWRPFECLLTCLSRSNGNGLDIVHSWLLGCWSSTKSFLCRWPDAFNTKLSGCMVVFWEPLLGLVESLSMIMVYSKTCHPSLFSLFYLYCTTECAMRVSVHSKHPKIRLHAPLGRFWGLTSGWSTPAGD